MQNLLVSFFSGFTCTLFLFILSALIVIGAKTLQIYIKTLLPKPQTPSVIEQPPQTPTPPKKATRKKTASKRAVIKSIEIDPKQVDRIYVKRAK